ncbi:glucosamine-6-phosphate isomerase [Phlyctema vagabunda]|uniref:Glucosamine-6-phosphate isomerase n=1 Tax=Phlyctema vagabunda TaxID=108571 RepID=A0ABR4PC27_9HELO
MWTLSSLQLHPHPMIVVDEDATLELQVKTVKYFKSIEKVAASQGFEQILPSAARTGPRTRKPQPTIQTKAISELQTSALPEPNSPSILSPKPTTNMLLNAPATDYPVRSHTPELVPDNMSSRIPEFRDGDVPFDRFEGRVGQVGA